MAQKKYYLDLTGLQKYDALIKKYIADNDLVITGTLVEGDYKTIKALSDAIKSLESSSHTHTNKDLLDTYTQTEANLADAVSKKHSHANADVLDGITAEKVTKWDQAVTDDHTHTNKTVLDGIDADKVAAWDAAQTNVIESVSVNGVDATITDKKATVTIPEATTTASGVMSAADKTKLDGIATGAEVNYIKSVGDNLAVDTDGKLTVTIPEATVTGVDDKTVDGLKLELTDKKVTLVDAGLAATLEGKDITLTEAATATEGYLKTYVLKQGTTEVGKIDLPKELVVTGGKVITAVEEDASNNLVKGEKYLELTIANQDKPVYIAVKDLVDVYTAGSGITIGTDNKISVHLAEVSGLSFKTESNGDGGLMINTVDTADINLSFDANGALQANFVDTYESISDEEIAKLFTAQ
jgi:hypothetical protein